MEALVSRAILAAPSELLQFLITLLTAGYSCSCIQNRLLLHLLIKRYAQPPGGI